MSMYDSIGAIDRRDYTWLQGNIRLTDANHPHGKAKILHHK